MVSASIPRDIASEATTTPAVPARMAAKVSWRCLAGTALEYSHEEMPSSCSSRASRWVASTEEVKISTTPVRYADESMIGVSTAEREPCPCVDPESPAAFR
eukprot:scaffold34129_cov32-Tisochrysis_lutea.AAC.7